MLIRYGRWGKFIGCANYPECKHTEQLLETTGHTCPQCGDTEEGELVIRKTRRGRTFFGCSRYPECDYSAWKLPETETQNSETETIADYDKKSAS